MSNAKFPYLTAEDVATFPSIKSGLDPEKELSYRQQASAFIQELGQRLQCTQCTMNTAIVYMHRFYYLNSFQKFHRNTMAPACLFLACKVEEQPRKVEHIIKVVYRILYREKQPPEPNSEEYLQKAEELVVNENILLQTLGFRIIVDHPHPHIVRYCDRELANNSQVSHHIAQVAWFLATNSLHLTTFCLQYPPTVIAALCIYLSCKYISYPLQSRSNQPWWYDVDRNTSEEILTKLAYEFVAIMDKAPTKYKTIKGSKIGSDTLLGQANPGPVSTNDDSMSAQGPGDIESAKVDDRLLKAEAIDEKGKEPGKSQRSVATTDDELASPPRKLSKLGTAISFKEYKARKVDQHVVQPSTSQSASESPSVEARSSVKVSSPAPATALGVDRVTAITTNKVPSSMRDLPQLEPLTLSMNDPEGSKSTDSTAERTKVPGDSSKVESSRHGSSGSKSDADKHRSTNHHQHKSSSGEEKKPVSGSASSTHSHDRHHRHHLHPHRSHSHHNRHGSGEKHHDASSAIKSERDSHHHHHHHRPHHHDTVENPTSGANGKIEKHGVVDPNFATSGTLPSKAPMIDGCAPDFSACQFMLATPPSPSSLQQQDMDIVKAQPAVDVTAAAQGAECRQTVA